MVFTVGFGIKSDIGILLSFVLGSGGNLYGEYNTDRGELPDRKEVG